MRVSVFGNVLRGLAVDLHINGVFGTDPQAVETHRLVTPSRRYTRFGYSHSRPPREGPHHISVLEGAPHSPHVEPNRLNGTIGPLSLTPGHVTIRFCNRCDRPSSSPPFPFAKTLPYLSLPTPPHPWVECHHPPGGLVLFIYGHGPHGLLASWTVLIIWAMHHHPQHCCGMHRHILISRSNNYPN